MIDDERARRLLQLEHILAVDVVAGKTGPHSTVFDRIARLTGQLQERVGLDPDAVDRLSVRLLLNDYLSALADLRALAAAAEEHLKTAERPLEDESCSRVRRHLGR